MRIIYIVRKNCFGEFAQGESFAFYARKRGCQNTFVTNDQRLTVIAKDDGFETIFTKNRTETGRIIKKIRPDVLFLCNSKTVFEYGMGPILDIEKPLGPYTASLDSNWLFLKEYLRNKKSHHRVPGWIDRIYVVIPEEIYRLGLVENGGHYKISEIYKKRIFCPGFIPSGGKISRVRKKQIRKELDIKNNEKLIFFYLGCREPLFPKIFLKLKSTIREFEKKGKKIKVLFKVRKKREVKEKWLIQKARVTTEEYDSYLASSDLIIQHHGLGTLPKVIHNQVPAICLVPEVKKDLPYYKHSEFYEIEPFRKSGLCYSLSYTVSSQKLKEKMENLLYNGKEMRKMKNAQRKYFKAGEESAFKDLLKQLRKRKSG